jgi:Transglutaminase-like superfamily
MRAPAASRPAQIAAEGPPVPAALSPAAKTRLAAEVVTEYARVRRALRREELPRVVRRLRAPAPARRVTPPLPDGARDGARLGAAVIRTLEPLPFDSRCLMRSLVLLGLLARRGVAGELVIAVRPSQELPALDAHAWVEVDGRALLAPAGPDHGRLLTL